jgi:hypothetical protein
MEPAFLLGALVEVVWHDAWFTEEDTTPADWEANMSVRTTGWIARILPDSISLAAEMFPDHKDSYRGITHIPKGIIKEVNYLGNTTTESS